MDKWININEAVGLFAKSERTLRRWIAEGRIKTRKWGSRRQVLVAPDLLRKAAETTIEKRLINLERRVTKLERGK